MEQRLSKPSSNQNAQYNQVTFNCDCSKVWEAGAPVLPKKHTHGQGLSLLILYAIPEISILNDKCTGLCLAHSTIGYSYSSDPSNFVQLPHSFRKPRQKHVFSNFFIKRYLLHFFFFFSFCFD